jgi:hypothetical protein
MSDVERRCCSRCGKGRSLVESLCSHCRGFGKAASNTFGLLRSKVLAVKGGWRDARLLDGDFSGWRCRHVHPTSQEAENCSEKESILGQRSPDAPPWCAIG